MGVSVAHHPGTPGIACASAHGHASRQGRDRDGRVTGYRASHCDATGAAIVNDAAMTVRNLVVEVTAAELDAVVAVNARGPYFAMQEAARALPAGGRVINVSSVATASASRA